MELEQALSTMLVSGELQDRVGFSAQIEAQLNEERARQDARYRYRRSNFTAASDAAHLGREGLAQAAQGAGQEALSLLQQALAIDAGNLAVLLDYGELLAGAGQQHEALSCFSRVLTSEPNNLRAFGETRGHYNLFRALRIKVKRRGNEYSVPEFTHGGKLGDTISISCASYQGKTRGK